MGLLLNRPSKLAYSTFFKSQNMTFAGNGHSMVHQGGPVQTDRAFLLHDSHHKGPETENIIGELSLSYSLESLKMLADDPPPHLRIFLGYSGWGPGQLAKEITTGAWLLGRANRRLVFDIPPERVWEAALREMGIEPVQLIHSGAVH
jgi:putative transcriptional regulator